MPADMKKIVIKSAPFVMVFWFSDKLSCTYRHIPGETFEKISVISSHLSEIFSPPVLSLEPADLKFAAICTASLYVLTLFRKMNKKKFRTGREYGSSSWGTHQNIKPFIDKDFFNNIILTQTESLTMENRVTPAKNGRNKNVLVIGGSGSGKTRFFVKPNLMQMHSSFVVTDPKGTIIEECGRLLDKIGNYRIKVLNLIDFSQSMHYNPLAYIREESDILKVVNTLITNTQGEGEKSKEDFWIKAERLLFTAYIAYIWYLAPEDEKNFTTLMYMLDASATSEENENFVNAIDILFSRLEQKDKDHFAVRQYKKYKLAAGKTAKSILISCAARLAPFDIRELRELMEYDELELDTLGDRKTALFVITSDTSDTFNFVAALMYSQMFDLLCDKAYMEYGGSLPVHVRCILDEFANLGKIPNFEKLIAVLRSRNMSASIILQSKAQLEPIYKEHSKTIISNCDSMLFLGGGDQSAFKEMSELLGKETIDMVNQTITKGLQEGASSNYQKTGRELMFQNELFEMDRGKCILMISGIKPFFSDKYDIEKHPHYKYLSDYDKRNKFSINKYLNRSKINVKPDEKVKVIV